MLEPNKLTEVDAPCYKRYSMNLDEMNLPESFRFWQLNHCEFWRHYKEVLKVGDIIEIRGRGADAEFIVNRVLRDKDGGVGVLFHGGHIPDEAALENASA
jgi:hypothetical protein